MFNLNKYLLYNKREFVLSKQILRSGTSVGANIEEGIGSPTRKDFVSKITIAHKEARETHHWIRLLRDSKFIEPKMADSLLIDCEEIKISGKIISTSKKTI
ncbi:MAG: four helix bundle protein [bacterium]